MSRIVVDPVTRIEGHLRIEAQMDGDRIAEAWSSGTMVRGIEIILRDRDPRDAWAFAQRICGVCTLVHGIASVRAVEDALSYEIPKNAQLIRNLMIGAQYIHDHVMHFYHLHALDWVDVVSALSADPAKTAELAQSLSSYPRSSVGYFRDVQNRLKKFVESGQLGPFANAYWGSPAYKLPPEANLMATTHYLEALDFQREIVKIHTIFGGRNPHPNWVVGGMPCSINVDEAGAVVFSGDEDVVGLQVPMDHVLLLGGGEGFEALVERQADEAPVPHGLRRRGGGRDPIGVVILDALLQFGPVFGLQGVQPVVRQTAIRVQVEAGQIVDRITSQYQHDTAILAEWPAVV